jgi:hypothetical protein
MIKFNFIILMPKNEDLYPVVNNYFLELWNSGTLEPWNPGTLEPWNFGTLEFWNPGTLELWNNYPSILRTCFVASMNLSISSMVL